MNDQQQALLALRQVHEQGAQQWAGVQIQTALGLVGQLGQVLAIVQLMDPQQIARVVRIKARVPLAVLLNEAEAQGVVLIDQRSQRALQQCRVERRLRLEHHGLIPVLALGNLQFEKARLNRQQGERTAALLHRRHRLFLNQPGDRRQLADGLFFEQLLGAELDALPLGAGDDLQAENRVAAQFEEIVGAADLLQLQDVGPDRCELFLDLADRRGVALLHHARLGQGTLVQLAVGGQRQAVEQHNLRGHHVVRQPCRQLFAQDFSAGRRYAIRHQLQARLVTFHRQRQHAGLAHRFKRQQHPRHLGRLDPIAAHLDLIVGATDELQQSLMVAAHAVAAAVDPSAILRKRVRHEAFGGQPGLSEITQRHAVTTDVQLSRHLRVAQVEHVIQHIRLRTR